MYEISDINVSFGSLKVLDGISAAFPEGTITVVLGPSGCGKTTLLNIVAGIIGPDAGVRSGFDGASFSYAFQEPRLLPWLSARDNVLFALSGVMERKAAVARSDVFFRSAGLWEFRNAMPGVLSGGMRQRLSLVRAFSFPSRIILLDEAFRAVDHRTRIELMDAFLGMWREERRTALVVTHDIPEAVYLADRVIVLSDRPAHVIDRFEHGQDRSDRRFGSHAAIELEARLYRHILGPD